MNTEQIAGSVQYSRMRHFGKTDFLKKYEMADYSVRFHEKFILKKSIIFVKFKKRNVVCAHELFCFAKKFVCTTYNVLGISALNSGAIFCWEEIF